MGSVLVIEIGHQANQSGQGFGEGDVSFSSHCTQDSHDEGVKQVQKLGELRRLV